jgi:Transposase DDE domain
MNKYPDFFINCANSMHKTYEALRAFHVDNLASKDISEKFGYSLDYFSKLKSQFHKQISVGRPPDFFITKKLGAPMRENTSELTDTILQLREQGMSVPDIQVVLSSMGTHLSNRWIDNILKKYNFNRLEKRTKQDAMKLKVPKKIIPEQSYQIDITELCGKSYRTIDGGIFYFLPLIVKLKIHKIVVESGFPETSVLSNINSFFSILALKLMDKERLSHTHALSFDAGLGLFAGLNVLPKNGCISSYSYNVTREMNIKFLKLLAKNVNSIIKFSGDINLDFTAIPHWGDKSVLEKNWSGIRRKALKSVLAVLAQDSETGILCYGNAEVVKESSKLEVLSFIDFWRDSKLGDLKCLIFDSKFTTLENLRKIDKDNIKFITIRERHEELVNEFKSKKKKKWKKVTLDNVKRKYRDLLVNDTKIIINLYDKTKKIRQIVIKNHGREEPTFILTNEFNLTAKQIVTKYARRWLVEKGISEAISFFHLNLLSSSIVIKVDFDLTMTILAHTLYKLLANQLLGFENKTARSLYIDFVHNGADIEIKKKEIHVKMLKKSHNPIIMSSEIFNTFINTIALTKVDPLVLI